MGKIEDLEGVTPKDCIRRISRNAASFKRIRGNRTFKSHFGSLWGETLKTIPKCYGRDHPEIELLRRTQICAVEEFDDGSVLSPRFQRNAVDNILAMKPFIDYLNSVIA